jgi:DNA processing protein
MGRRSRRDAADWVALLLARPTARTLSRLAGYSCTAGEIFALPDKQLREEFGMRAEELSRFRAPVDAKAQQTALDAWERHGMRLITLGEADYPRNLLSAGLPPGALFVRGELLPEDTLAIAIVGSRAASISGLEMASRLAREFAPIFTIISGCALGIDSASHAAALNAGGRTIGVAACGLDIDYPSASRDLREYLLRCGRGVMVSPFLPGTPPMRANFLQRNAVLAGMSLAAVIVEAAARSGALSTARHAADDGRPVYAVPGDADARHERRHQRTLA